MAADGSDTILEANGLDDAETAAVEHVDLE